MERYVHDKNHMKLHVIHDNRRIERYEPLMEGLWAQGITESDIVIWPAQVLGDVVSSINASHKAIVRLAQQDELPLVCIAEDDLMFTRAGAWQYFLDNMPQSFDLYLGCTYVVPVEIKKVTGFHLYIVHSKFYERYLNVPHDVHIDTAMDDVGGDYHFCYPFPALQRAGFSANNKAFSNYNSVLRPQDIYGGGLHNI
jgi:hypothetical protein